ncbi:cytoskeletal protein CcmA (bactofilin family) [Parabacteroides sp. PFB2-10]|uniref:bactofilin family protein n=1 Tax=Parabacteroides sp. PFB2-10 TaxID=1742405 RepID=UPI002473A407|nr:polymer-forming cytoskeletal protein [Parabacteroides sp. PFB2-10]MDH6313213.1 cytoskeletal protein CcmA (bactofilin family) [Parabacteroides sp. PFB2-10]
MGKQYEEVVTGNSYNTISVDTTIIGNVITETDFRLDGKVEGEISCKGKLVIGTKAKVKGIINARSAEVLGEIEGMVIAEILVVRSSAVINGDIVAQSLEVQPDAQVNGTFSMKKQAGVQYAEAPTTPSLDEVKW